MGLAQEALELVEAENHQPNLVQASRELQVMRALDALGQVLTRLGDSGGAIDQLRRAEEIARRYGDPVRLLPPPKQATT